jgi:hypothetical protein
VFFFVGVVGIYLQPQRARGVLFGVHVTHSCSLLSFVLMIPFERIYAVASVSMRFVLMTLFLAACAILSGGANRESERERSTSSSLHTHTHTLSLLLL